MDKILNDNYDDKYTRATVVYALSTPTSGVYTASLDAAGEQLINSADLYEIATKGIIIRIENNTMAFPNCVIEADNNPTVVMFRDGTDHSCILVATDPIEGSDTPIMEDGPH